MLLGGGDNVGNITSVGISLKLEREDFGWQESVRNPKLAARDIVCNKRLRGEPVWDICRSASGIYLDQHNSSDQNIYEIYWCLARNQRDLMMIYTRNAFLTKANWSNKRMFLLRKNRKYVHECTSCSHLWWKMSSWCDRRLEQGYDICSYFDFNGLYEDIDKIALCNVQVPFIIIWDATRPF